MARARLSPFLLALVACSEGSNSHETPDVPGLALSTRTPDERVEELERIRPTIEEGWGRHGLGGWRPYPSEEAGGRVGVGTNSAAPELLLPALGERARRVELDLLAFQEDAVEGDAAPSAEVELRLNEQSLGTTTVGAEPTTIAFESPPEAWQAGQNRLRLELAATNEGDPTPTVQVFEVRYGDPHRVLDDVDAGTVALEDRAEVVYFAERAADAQAGRDLFLAGSAEGKGTLEISFERLDPATGLREMVNGHRLRASVADLEGGVWAPVPAASTAVLVIRLGWIASAPDSRVTLSDVFLREPSVADLPPIVFVSIDTLAAQNLSVYGYPRKTSPVLEEFASEAIVFTNARSNAPWTVTSYASQLTGLYPEAHMLDEPEEVGGEEPPEPWERVKVAPSRWTLAELLRARGYATGGFVDNPWFRQQFGYDQGFDHYDTSPTLRNLHDPDGGIRLASTNALAWLDEKVRPDAPFFLFVQALEPHAPYLPSEPFQGAFEGQDSPVPDIALEVGVGHLTSFGYVSEHVARGMTEGEELPPSMNARAIGDAYDERILEVDAEIGKLFDALRERGLYDDAVIVVSADHGEAMGRHDMFFNHSLLYDEVTWVPLLVRLPGGRHGGRRVDANVQLVDLYPTLSELAGVPPRRFLHGRSILDEELWEQDTPDAPVRGVYAMGGLQDQRSIVAGRWKLIVSSADSARLHVKLTHPRLPAGWLAENAPDLVEGLPRNREEQQRWTSENRDVLRELSQLLSKPYMELYDLVADPEEQDNVASEHPEVVQQLLLELTKERERSLEARQRARFEAEGVVLDEGSLKALGDLGYAGDD